MDFEEYFKYAGLREEFRCIAKSAFDSGQEYMRERAVSVAKQGFNRALTGDEIADQIQDLPIEV